MMMVMMMKRCGCGAALITPASHVRSPPRCCRLSTCLARLPHLGSWRDFIRPITGASSRRPPQAKTSRKLRLDDQTSPNQTPRKLRPTQKLDPFDRNISTFVVRHEQVCHRRKHWRAGQYTWCAGQYTSYGRPPQSWRTRVCVAAARASRDDRLGPSETERQNILAPGPGRETTALNSHSTSASPSPEHD